MSPDYHPIRHETPLAYGQVGLKGAARREKRKMKESKPGNHNFVSNLRNQHCRGTACRARYYRASYALPKSSTRIMDYHVSVNNIRNYLALSAQCPHHRFRFAVYNLQQNPRWSFGVADSPLPVANSSRTQSEQRCKPVLRQTKLFPQVRDIDIRNLYLMCQTSRCVAVSIRQSIIQTGHDFLKCYPCYLFTPHIFEPAFCPEVEPYLRQVSRNSTRDKPAISAA